MKDLINKLHQILKRLILEPFSFLVHRLILHPLTCLLKYYVRHLRKEVNIVRNVARHLWIPLSISVVSSIVFSVVSQTLDVYRSLALDHPSKDWQIIFGSALVFLLSFLVWRSGRLLSYQYIEEYKFDGKDSNEIEFRDWAGMAVNNSFDSICKALYIEYQNIKECILCIICNREFQNVSHNNSLSFIENLSLLYLPRLAGMLPFSGFVYGLHKISSEKDINLFVWLNVSYVALVFLFFLLFVRRFSLFRKSEKNSTNKPVWEEGLFSPKTENFLANSALIVFALSSLPIISHLSGKVSNGVAYFFAVCVVTNTVLNYWNPYKNTSNYIDKTFDWNLLILAFCAISSGAISLFIPPFAFSNALGAIGIIAFSLCILTVTLSTIYNFGYDKKFPAVSYILIAALIASGLNLNNNHQIRYIEGKKINNNNNELATEFKTWLESRPDLDKFSDKPYPVYIVSAQGGGIYAAYNSAYTLSYLHDNLHDDFSSFTDHVFAISAVSGGAIGSSIYASLAKASAQQDSLNISGICKDLSDCTEEIFKQDLLSPIFSMGLFPDLLQRFLFFAINDWDRSRALEFGVEESWNNQFLNRAKDASNPLEKPFYEFWKPHGSAPALIINTTNVDNGERLVISPFRISDVDTMLDYDVDKNDFSLSTAAALSARFPVISSEGWFRHNGQSRQVISHSSNQKYPYKTRLVDGGYYDNSGLSTSQNIIIDLKKSLATSNLSSNNGGINPQKDGKKIVPEFISLAIVGIPPVEERARQTFQGFNEISSPFFSFWNVYSNRSDTAIDRAKFELNRDAIDSGTADPSDYHYRAFYLDSKDLPLGWLLSEMSQKNIRAQTADFKKCNMTKREQIDIMLGDMTDSSVKEKNNNCVARIIAEELHYSPESTELVGDLNNS